MKYIIIFLLSVSGVEEIKFETHGLNCSDMAQAWMDINTTYYDMIKGDPKLQGNYTKDGKLFMGWIC
jgi:hypothetical protein